MNIDDACRIVRRWADLFAPDSEGGGAPGGLSEAVAEIKRYLELEMGEDGPIRELEIA